MTSFWRGGKTNSRRLRRLAWTCERCSTELHCSVELNVKNILYMNSSNPRMSAALWLTESHVQMGNVSHPSIEPQLMTFISTFLTVPGARREGEQGVPRGGNSSCSQDTGMCSSSLQGLCCLSGCVCLLLSVLAPFCSAAAVRITASGRAWCSRS